MITPRELSSPLRVDSSGGFASISALTDIAEEHLRAVIGTQVGERVMLPDYGTDSISLLFETDDVTTKEIVRRMQSAVNTFCPEVSIIGIDTSTDRTNGTIGVTVRYTLHNDVEQSVTINNSYSTS